MRLGERKIWEAIDALPEGDPRIDELLYALPPVPKGPGLRLGELFAGYGGLGMAVEEVFGATTAWFSEWEAAPSKVLAHRWPNVPNYGDVTKIDWAGIEPVDIISGGSPCQDLSLAGKRRGMNEGTRSNLWESMREGIAIIQPKYVVWENVRGALSAEATSVSDMGQREGFLGERGGHLRALGRVLGDLADLGYDAEWRGLRAADVGAPHGRFRVFILASHRDHLGINRAGERAEQDRRGQLTNRRHVAANADHPAGNGKWSRQEPRQGSKGTSSDADNAGSQGQRDQAGTAQAERRGHSSEGVDWREYAGAVRRWEAVHGTAPSPVEMGPTGKPRLSAHFAEWMMGVPAGWITDVPDISRSDQLKACGNGVVPAQAAAALTDMLHAFQAKDIAA